MPQVMTIPAGVAFLDALATGLLAEVEDRPGALADALILLPNRRACRGLAEAFLRSSGGRPLLLPRIQPIGEVDAEELLLDGTLDLALPPAIGRVRRLLLLTRLLSRGGWSFEHGLSLATDLAALLDEVETERGALAGLERLVPDELAAHWQKSRELLEMVADTWPPELAGTGLIDPNLRRHRLLSELAERWRADMPDRRIVAAGSTGSIPATRSLLRAIAALPRGTVVLPGLDRTLDAANWRALEPGHPQWGLRQLLEALGVAREDVRTWPHAAPATAGAARARFLAEVMRPAATIEAWQALPKPPAEATAGLMVEVHADLPAEALAIATRMRGVLETPGRTAALVTPDRDLARRVAVELRRWRVEVDDSAGIPLDQTPPGAFLSLTARLVIEDITPVALLAVLKHPMARGGQPLHAFRRAARQLERACLRGPRLAGGFAGILSELHRQQESADQPSKRERLERLGRWVNQLAAWTRGFQAVVGPRPVALRELLRAHVGFTETLARDEHGRVTELWRGEAGETAASLLSELLEACADGHEIPASAYPSLLTHGMAMRPVRPRAPRHRRLFIWGELEARLQQADVTILGGLNEDVWPRRADPGPWLNRTMREQLDLAPVERLLGLSAHDFAQLAAAPEVVLSRADKDARGQPTVPSRWLVRLQTLLAAKDSQDAVAGDHVRAWSQTLDRIEGPPRPCPQPKPRPPVDARPRRLSISDIGLWMRDPYALYAKRVLNLRPLEQLDADPGALERGNVIHHVLEAFVKAYPDALPDAALERLLDLGRRHFGQYAHRPQVRALWWPRFEAVARWVIDQERARRKALVEIMAEVTGEHTIEAPAGPFVLKGRADRLERHADRRLGVIDYKTGAAPKDKDVLRGYQPQLPLEAAMVRAGAFDGVDAAEVASLLVWSLRGDGRGCVEEQVAKKQPVEQLAAAALAGLGRLIAHYDDPRTVYPSPAKPRVSYPGDYDHLARRGEWEP
jgi:ATP-dependent helicase/nuclease subunit B